MSPDSLKLEVTPSEPLYVKVAAQLREQIASGAFKPGEQLPSFGQMKAQYGLSQATMERVHLLLERDQIIERRRGLGTFVVEFSRGKTTGVLGVAGGEASEIHPYYRHLLEGARAAAHEQNFEVLLLHENSRALFEKVDGVLLIASTTQAARLPLMMPRVSLLFPQSQMPSVVADDAGGVRAAVAHLHQLGHRKIAFMTQAVVEGADELSKQRLKAYRSALREFGIRADARWVRAVVEKWREGRDLRNLAQEGMESWLRDDWQRLGCSALLAQNDEAAVGIVEALQKSGLRVPDDVSVVGFDGTEVSDYFRPQLTTVEVPLQEIGRCGVETLLAQIAENPVPYEPQVLPTRFKIGASTAPPR